MNSDSSPTHESSTNPISGRGDVDVKYVTVSGIGLILLIGITLIGLVLFLSGLDRFSNRQRASTNEPDANQTPPDPKLQPNPPHDLASFRKKEEQILGSYGWIDRDRSIVRIPLSRSMHLLAERGIPEPEGPVELPPTRGDKP